MLVLLNGDTYSHVCGCSNPNRSIRYPKAPWISYPREVQGVPLCASRTRAAAGAARLGKVGNLPFHAIRQSLLAGIRRVDSVDVDEGLIGQPVC